MCLNFELLDIVSSGLPQAPLFAHVGIAFFGLGHWAKGGSVRKCVVLSSVAPTGGPPRAQRGWCRVDIKGALTKGGPRKISRQ